MENELSVWLHNARSLIFNRTTTVLNERAVDDLRSYLDGFDGRLFERIYESNSPHRFTSGDLLSVTALSVVVPPSAAVWILGDEGSKATGALLSKINSDAHIEDLTSDEFGIHLGHASPAWKLWAVLFKQPGIGTTIAGKLMAAKRPHLIPISDSYVKETLGTDERNLWKCLWGILSNDEIRAGVLQLRNEVAAARELSLLRVVDVIAWRAGKRAQTK
jgi:hypothetical protein